MNSHHGERQAHGTGGDSGGFRPGGELPSPARSRRVRISRLGNPVKDFEQWMEKVLPAAYGERKFIKLNLKGEDVYE